MQSLMLYLGLLRGGGMKKARPGVAAPGTFGMMQIGDVTVQFGLATNGLILYRYLPTRVPVGSPVVGRVMLAGGVIAIVYYSRNPLFGLGMWLLAH